MADLRQRFRAKQSGQFLAAFWELYLHELFSRLGFKALVHPASGRGGTRPDFLVTQDEMRFYLEAVMPTPGFSPSDNQPASVATVTEYVNEAFRPQFWLRLRHIIPRIEPASKEGGYPHRGRLAGLLQVGGVLEGGAAVERLPRDRTTHRRRLADRTHCNTARSEPSPRRARRDDLQLSRFRRAPGRARAGSPTPTGREDERVRRIGRSANGRDVGWSTRWRILRLPRSRCSVAGFQSRTGPTGRAWSCKATAVASGRLEQKREDGPAKCWPPTASASATPPLPECFPATGRTRGRTSR